MTPPEAKNSPPRARRRLRILAGALATASLVSVPLACGDEEPALRSAATWGTWVLDSPAAVRVPPPPANRSAIARREARGVSVVGPWIEAALAFVSRRTKDPPASSRAYALLSVAMSDAAVSAAHWQRVHGDPGYPSSEAAIASAASDVLHEVFPEAPAGRYRAMVARIAADHGDREAAERGMELGHGVARAVIAFAREDGSMRTWDGSRPRARGTWQPPPGSVARPVEPLAGRWRTWVLRSGDQFRAPPPPAYDGARFRAEAREVADVTRTLTPRRKEIARYWAGGEGTPLPAGIWNQIALGYLRAAAWDTTRVARALALVNVALADAGVAAWDTKFAYWSPRPENAIRDLGIDGDFDPYLDTPFFPSYVSGHATYSGAVSEVLAHLFPDDAERIRAKADEAAVSRLYGGIHFAADNVEGLAIGRRIGRLVVRRAETDEAR